MHHNIVNTDISQGEGIVSGAGKWCFFSERYMDENNSIFPW